MKSNNNRRLFTGILGPETMVEAEADAGVSYESDICNSCVGTGEGPASGTKCYKCRGKGAVKTKTSTNKAN